MDTQKNKQNINRQRIWQQQWIVGQQTYTQSTHRMNKNQTLSRYVYLFHVGIHCGCILSGSRRMWCWYGSVLYRFGIEFQEKHFRLFFFILLIFLLFIFVCKAIVLACLTCARNNEKEEKIKYNNTYNRGEMSQQ